MKGILVCAAFFCVNLVAAQHTQVINAFKQAYKVDKKDDEGNCASIATVKSAIELYGVGNIFRITWSKSAGKYFVILRSGRELQLTSDEMLKGIAATGFRETNSHPDAIMIKRYADTCFAVMAKHLELTPPLQPEDAKYSTYEKALEDLNDGFNVPDAVTLLGLRYSPLPSSIRKLRGFGNAIMSNEYHGVMTSYGFYDAPRKEGLERIRKFGRKYSGRKCLWIFCGPCDAYELEAIDL